MKHVQADKYLNFETWLSRQEVRRMEKACFRYFELKEKKNHFDNSYNGFTY
jgi:hypothetical protein